MHLTLLFLGISLPPKGFKPALISCRTLPTTNDQERLEVERCYKCGQVDNKILDLWYSYVVPPSLLVAGTTIVLSAYISIRHTELPLLVYGFFPCVTIELSVMVFALCYDGYWLYERQRIR